MGCNATPACFAPKVCYQNASWMTPSLEEETGGGCLCCIYYGLLQGSDGECSVSSNFAVFFRTTISAAVLFSLWCFVKIVIDLCYLVPLYRRAKVRSSFRTRSAINLSMFVLVTLLSGSGQAIVYLVEREAISEIQSDPNDGCVSSYTALRSWFYMPYAFAGFWGIYGVAETWLTLTNISDSVKERVQRILLISKSLSSAFLALVSIALGIDMLVVCAIAPVLAAVLVVYKSGKAIIAHLEVAKSMQYSNQEIFDKPIKKIQRNCRALIASVSIVIPAMLGYTLAPRSHEQSSFVKQGFTLKGVLSLLVVLLFVLLPVAMYSYCHFINLGLQRRAKNKTSPSTRPDGPSTPMTRTSTGESESVAPRSPRVAPS